MLKSKKNTSKLPYLSRYTLFLLASLGFHGVLLGVVLPKVSEVSVKESQYQQEHIVPVIELNALEQARLPISSTLIEEIPLGIPDSSAIPTPQNPPFVPALPPPPPPPIPQIAYAPPPLLPGKPNNPSATITPSPQPSTPPTFVPKDVKNINQTASNQPPALLPTVEEQKKIVATRQKSLLQSIEERAKLLQEDKLNTTDEEAQTNKANWLNKIQAEAATELEMAGVFPKDACMKKLSGTAVYGVIVDEEGKVIESELIRSSGYGIFNEQVRETIEKTSKDSSMEANKPYQVSVKFEYDEKVCPSLSVTNLQKGPKPPAVEPNDQDFLPIDSQPNLEKPKE